MYSDHFGLRGAPFSLSPSLRYYFLSRAQEEAMAHLLYGLEQGEDFILITGRTGTGKTLALRKLQSQIPTRYQNVIIDVTQLDLRELLKTVALELGLEIRPEADKADLLAGLKRAVAAKHAQDGRVLLIVDEAQNLDLDVLEGVRLLANLKPFDSHALQIVLSGQPALETKLNSPKLEQFRQRIRVHYRLELLNSKEIGEYLNHRTSVAGATGSLFSAGAAEAIYRVSGGVPRLANVAADRALLSAYLDGAKIVKTKHVEPVGTASEDEAEVIGVRSAAALESARRDAAPSASAEPAPADAAPAAPRAERIRSPLAFDSEPAGAYDDEPRRSWRWIVFAAAALVVAAALVFGWRHFFVDRPLATAETTSSADTLTAEQGEREGGATSPRVAASDATDAEDTWQPITDPTDSARATDRLEPTGGGTGDENAASGERAESRPGAERLDFSRNLPRAGRGAPVNAGPDRVTDDRRAEGAATSSTAGIAAATDRESAGRDRGAATPPPPTDAVSGPAVVERAQPDRGTGAGPAGSGSTGSGAAATVGSYGVHVASFREMTRTDRFTHELESAGYPSFVRDRVIDGRTWHRVYVGPYADRSDAERTGRQLQDRGISPYYFVAAVNPGGGGSSSGPDGR